MGLGDETRRLCWIAINAEGLIVMPMLISVNSRAAQTPVTWYYVIPFTHIGSAKVTNESIR